ncbi:MAG: hypothetical protein KJZ55_09180, partial [Flavobacteriales bacterium]|nr:hypothetical protein [Flavobacteriales bacterium]
MKIVKSNLVTYFILTIYNSCKIVIFPFKKISLSILLFIILISSSLTIKAQEYEPFRGPNGKVGYKDITGKVV